MLNITKPTQGRLLSGLERLGAVLPHALAVPVMLAHEALCTLAERR